LPWVRNSRVTYGSSAAVTSTLRRTTCRRRAGARAAGAGILAQGGEEGVEAPADGEVEEFRFAGPSAPVEVMKRLVNQTRTIAGFYVGQTSSCARRASAHKQYRRSGA
jgi:hypothetical protein